MQRHQPTIFGGVPTLYAALLAQSAHRPGRRIGPAAPLHLGRRGAARAISASAGASMVGVDILDGIGSTEMLHIFVSQPRRTTSATAPPASRCPATNCAILDEHGGRVPNGEAGELVVRGPSAADGYWNQRDKTRRTFRGEWTHTGDTYIRDADGYYRFCGRTDEMLKVSGIWVSPFEVEEALVAHPAVLEVGGGRRARIATG